VTAEPRLRVVPRRSLLTSAVFSIVAVFVPVSAVFYWFAIPRGLAGWVAAGQIVVVIVSFAVLLRQLSIDTVVTDEELRGHGIFSPLVRVPLSAIASVHLVPVYVGQTAETVHQLLVRDAAGRRLYRMRGVFWHPADLHRVAEALPVPTTLVTEPMATGEFLAAYPGSAYWFENRPWLTAILIVLAAVAGIAIAVGTMVLLGMPIMA